MAEPDAAPEARHDDLQPMTAAQVEQLETYLAKLEAGHTSMWDLEEGLERELEAALRLDAPRRSGGTLLIEEEHQLGNEAAHEVAVGAQRVPQALAPREDGGGWLLGVQWLGVAVSVLGVLLVITRGPFAILEPAELHSGDFITLLSLASWAVYTVYGKRVLATYSPLLATTAAVRLLQLPVETIGARFGAVPSGFPGLRIPMVNWHRCPRSSRPRSRLRSSPASRACSRRWWPTV